MHVLLNEVIVRDLGKRYHETWALRGVSASFYAGQVSLLLGQNGSGKSTLLALLSTLLSPSRGNIFYDGLTLSQIEESKLRATLSLLSHEPRLYDDLTAKENLQLFGALYAISPSIQKQKIATLTEAFQLTTVSHKLVSTFSKGMKQRLALARTFLTSPRLLLLDEPYSHLDVSGKAILTQHIKEAQQQGAIILIATHDIEQIASLCTQALVLYKGQLHTQATFLPNEATAASLLSLLTRKLT